MLTESVQSRLDAWDLTPEGELVETGSSWLVPVRSEERTFGTHSAMLKVAKPDSDERPGMALLQWWGGEGAVSAPGARRPRVRCAWGRQARRAAAAL